MNTYSTNSVCTACSTCSTCSTCSPYTNTAVHTHTVKNSVSLDHVLYLARPFAKVVLFAAALALAAALLLTAAITGTMNSLDTQSANVAVLSADGQSVSLPGLISGTKQYVQANAYIGEYGGKPAAAAVYYENTAYYPLVNGKVSAE